MTVTPSPPPFCLHQAILPPPLAVVHKVNVAVDDVPRLEGVLAA